MNKESDFANANGSLFVSMLLLVCVVYTFYRCFCICFVIMVKRLVKRIEQKGEKNKFKPGKNAVCLGVCVYEIWHWRIRKCEANNSIYDNHKFNTWFPCHTYKNVKTKDFCTIMEMNGKKMIMNYMLVSPARSHTHKYINIHTCLPCASNRIISRSLLH